MTIQQTQTVPAYRPFVTTVLETQRLSSSYVRVTFGCVDFEHIGLHARDQRVKLVIPGASGTVGDFGQHDETTYTDWYAQWRELPEAERGFMRTYTIRNPDPAARTIDVDFVVHHEPGPAGAWALQAQTGQEIVVIAPDARTADPSIGSDWHPGTAQHILLAGDETAAPGIAGILEKLDSRYSVTAFIEVAHADDRLDITTDADVTLNYLVRGDLGHGEKLVGAVRAWADDNRPLLEQAAAPRTQELAVIDVDTDLLWESPADSDGDFYAWVAGESAAVKTIRRTLVTEHGVDRKRVAFMGYWRLGKSERQG
ncbi:siderophore-interacting protein [Agrococcus casei]|uniref:siderophore-interacting protein n=1 Tax=Agrococcus casei TaxID=343512 RepID=UPI003F8EA581